MAFSSIFDLWKKWNIQGILILSLSLQVFLILCASLRKKISNKPIVFLLWLAYLMADWVAAIGIGYISHNQGNLFACTAKVDIALQAFWASFLLLHLGGPDTITAFSLQDSSLWRRHLLSLIFQISVSIYVFVQTFPSDKSLMIPTMLVFFAGVIKNVERILALFFSSNPILTSMSQSFTFGLAIELNILEYENSYKERGKLTESIVVKHAHSFFKVFATFLSDLFCNGVERHRSRIYFHKVSALDALRVISVELNFMYEALYTKALAIHSKCSYIFRFIAFIEVIVAFVLFNRFKKHQLPKLDVAITYILLFGGIALDVINLFTLIFSDWIIAKIRQPKTRQFEPDSFLLQPKVKLGSFLHKLMSAVADLRMSAVADLRMSAVADLRNPRSRFATCKVESNANAKYAVLHSPFIFRKWSESISTCNIFSESLKVMTKTRDRSGDIITFSKAKIIIYLFRLICKIFVEGEVSCLVLTPRYTLKNRFIIELWEFIFEEVKRKSVYARNPIETRKIFEARGNLFLQDRPGADALLEFVTKPTYDVSILLWHIATEICYRQEDLTKTNDKREFSKILSDYMFYLLLNQSNVMSTSMGFAQFNIMKTLRDLAFSEDAKDVEELCKAIYKDVNLDWTKPLNLGIGLAQKMESFGERKWEVMSGVWVEMLSYAAGHTKGKAIGEVLSKGGELLAFVWLLMAHFGCLYKPEWGTFEVEFFGAESETELNDGNGNEEEDVSTV